jgi:hypothetical protein
VQEEAEEVVEILVGASVVVEEVITLLEILVLQIQGVAQVAPKEIQQLTLELVAQVL